MYSLGIPRNSIINYKTALKSDKFLVIAHGSGDDVVKARMILESTATGDLVVRNKKISNIRVMGGYR